MMTTTNIDVGTRVSIPTAEEMRAWFHRPIVIGSLWGFNVWLFRETREVMFGECRCSVDHHYLEGTRLQAHAKEILDGNA